MGGEHATLDEVAAALRALMSADRARVLRVARLRATNTDMSGEDLLHTAIERRLAGDRHWHRLETFVACLARTMKSIVQDWWRRRQVVEIITEADAGFVEDDDGNETGAIDRAASHVADPEKQAIAREALEEVFAALKDDKKTLEIALELATGESPEDIRDVYELTQTRV